jgi:Meckel syndrome type 1 protein
MSGKEQFEREFESFLTEDDSRLAALYRKLPRLEPDAKLDAAVTAMSRRTAAATAPVRVRRPRWLPALSAAAVVALAAGVAYRIGPQSWQERERALQKTINENAVSTPASPPAAEMARRADADAFQEKDAGSAASKPAAEPAAPPPPATTAVPRPAPVASAPPAGYAAPAQHVEHERVRKVENAAKRADAPAPQAFPLQTERAQELKSAEPAAPGAAADSANAQAAGAIAPERQRFKRDEKAPAPVPAPASTAAAPAAPAAAALPPPPPLREESAPAPAETAAPPKLETQTVTGGSIRAVPTLAAPAPAAKAAKVAPERPKDPNASLYPEHWLANIRALLREHKRDDALRSLGEFRKMYPDYHLPDDLRDLK